MKYNYEDYEDGKNDAHTEDRKGCRIHIKYDNDGGDSPRDWDNLGTIVDWHRRITIGDKKIDGDWTISKRDNIVLPVYIYQHGGVTINTTGFSCQWDSSQVGWIYVSKKDAVANYGRVRCTKSIVEKAKAHLVGEIKALDDFFTGNVYGYVIEFPDGKDDSLWGYYPERDEKPAYTGCLSEAQGIVDRWASKHEQQLPLPIE